METVGVHSETSGSASETAVLVSEDIVDTAPVLRLRLQKPKSDRKVVWREGTVDNEDMGKKKSKCCCIYKKPVTFGESSSSDDEECEHCFGHPEKRRKNLKNETRDHQHVHPNQHNHGHTNEEPIDDNDHNNHDQGSDSYKDHPWKSTRDDEPSSSQLDKAPNSPGSQT